jgi:hypothetical protein
MADIAYTMFPSYTQFVVERLRKIRMSFYPRNYLLADSKYVLERFTLCTECSILVRAAAVNQHFV